MTMFLGILSTILNVIAMIFVVVVAVISIYCLVIELYSVFLSLFGYKKAEKDYEAHDPEARFLILVAAHNEEQVIGSTLENLLKIDYPEHLYDLVVVNDNSTDRTGEICDQYGVRHVDTIEGLYEREGVGKSAGLQYALRHLGFDKLPEKYDLLLVLDADNHIDPFLLTEVNSQWIHEGKPTAIQAYLDSKNSESTIATGYAASYYITNRFFQLSKKRLGFNNAIGGTGFSVRMDWLIETGGFCYKSLVEDLEMSIEIFKSGGRVSWNHFARVYDEKPDELGVSIKQRIRWCQGHWYVAFTNGWTLLKGFVKSGFNFRWLDQFLYLFSMGKALLLVVLAISVVTSISVEIAQTQGIPMEGLGELAVSLVHWLVPVNIIRFFTMGYSFAFVPIYATYVDGSHKINPFKIIFSVFFIGITYIYTQIVGLFKWRNQSTWVKTPHKHTKSIEAPTES